MLAFAEVSPACLSSRRMRNKVNILFLLLELLKEILFCIPRQSANSGFRLPGGQILAAWAAHCTVHTALPTAHPAVQWALLWCSAGPGYPKVTRVGGRVSCVKLKSSLLHCS